MDNSFQNTVLVIAGPTAVGKTAIAISVARQLGTEILSADSRQCYKEMQIGTAKPTISEQQGIKHHFIDEYPVTRAISAADYESIGMTCLEQIFLRKDVAIVCGGTGLYIKALCEGLDPMPETKDEVVAVVEQIYRDEGLPKLQELIKMEDPLFFESGEIQNPARLIRALSFVRSTGQSILDFRTGQKKIRPFRIVKTALELPREVLYSRINQRVDKMMEEGLLQEVEQLYPHKNLKNLQTVGYSELFDYMDGHLSLMEAVDKIKQHTRNYAKRQLTWFKKDKSYIWFDASDPDVVQKILDTAKRSAGNNL